MDVLTGFAKFFELLNSNSGGLTFLITVVYVIATIAIYKANIQSANASKKQLEEMQKQYALLCIGEQRFWQNTLSH